MTVKSVIAQSGLLRLVIGLKISCQPVSQPMTSRTKTNCTLCTHNNFSRTLSKLQVIAKNSDWFITLFAPVVTGWGNYYFGVGSVPNEAISNTFPHTNKFVNLQPQHP